MKRFGISGKNMIGGPGIPALRKMAKQIGKDHKLAKELWDSDIHEAKILAGMIDDVKYVTENQMDSWVADFDSWDICDQTISNLFDSTELAEKKACQWIFDEREFVRRAGFVMMAAMSVHRKDMEDDDFLKFFPLIKKYSTDERNFVKKAVNWALRQIGKRSKALRKEAIRYSLEIQKLDSKSARWIAADALRELKR